MRRLEHSFDRSCVEISVSDPDAKHALWRHRLVPSRRTEMMMTTRNWSALGQRLEGGTLGSDAEPYAEYLRCASGVEAIAATKRDRDRLLGLRPGARALEVCCGLGDDARRLASLVEPGGSVVGVDASRALLERARRDAPEVTWVVGDAHQLPFEASSFDAARVERALQHVAEPERVIGEMVRVVRPGGIVLACEPDWGTMALSTNRQDLVDALAAAAEASITHPRVGRALPALLVDAGLEEVEVAAEATVIRDFELLRVLGDLPALVAVTADGDSERASELDSVVSQLERDGAAGRLLAMITLVSAWGRATT
jgi:SAM-dependent methyltransferase